MDHTLFSGKRLKELRQACSLTATQLGERVGISEDAVRKIESGRSKQPSFITGVKIAEALAVSPAELAFGKDSTQSGDLLAKTIRALRKKRSELAEDGIQHAAVFGSVARGESTKDSDIDILIDRDPDKHFTYMTLSKIAFMLEDILGRPIDIATRPSITERYNGILMDAVYAF